MLNPPTVEPARSIIGDERNPYRKVRRLSDCVCGNCTCNYVWYQGDATFTWGCASAEVRCWRIGDCVIQAMFGKRGLGQ